MMANKNEKVAKEALFTKEQLLQSTKFSDRKDLLNALLEDNRLYTITNVTNLINRFMKGKVN